MDAIKQTSNKVRYSDSELAMFKVLIEKKLARAKEQLNYFQSQMDDFIDNPDTKMKGLSDAAGIAENEILGNSTERLSKHITHLENALFRIENKTYGICRVTGELIDKKRLQAVPHATLSMEAKLGRKK
jgi:RNA polymerase-binding transcription factor DksA